MKSPHKLVLHTRSNLFNSGHHYSRVFVIRNSAAQVWCKLFSCNDYMSWRYVYRPDRIFNRT